MSTAHQILVTLLDVLNTHDLARLQTVFSPFFRGTDCAQPGVIRGVEGLEASLQSYLAAFPDLSPAERRLLGLGEQAAGSIGQVASAQP